MTLVETLLDTAYEDTQLLLKNDSLGDAFSIARDVDFVLRASEHKRAETVASFINDNRYGNARVESAEAGYRVVVTVHMPTTQQVLCAVSALMVCLAHLFSVEYDGWETVIQRH
jgi:hypothetical protein